MTLPLRAKSSVLFRAMLMEDDDAKRAEIRRQYIDSLRHEAQDRWIRELRRPR